MTDSVKISVIMSVYNGEDYLSETLESVINQTFSDWELIVINDCSTDSTSEILSKYANMDERIKVHTNEVNLRLPSSLCAYKIDKNAPLHRDKLVKTQKIKNMLETH